ncbi:MAG TPA: hydrogenase maturation protease [Actinoplanes sp.]|nr:hydrogenase maturation protease [Actinoplanes sp.]
MDVAAPPGRPLVIGYGNRLRSDDGVGWTVADALRDDPRAAAVDVIATTQLNPEHAADLAAARLAVFVDASVAGDPPPAPGAYVLSRLPPPGLPSADGAPPPAWSHHCTPAGLQALAAALYGAAPPVVLVGVGVADCAVGEELGPTVAAAVPNLVDVVLKLALEATHA